MLDLGHPIFTGPVKDSITRLTPENLAPVLNVPSSLVHAVVTELASAREEEDPGILDRRYWSPTRRLIHRKFGTTSEPVDVELTREIGRVLFRSLYQKAPNRSPVGRLLLEHAVGMIENGSGPRVFFQRPQVQVEEEEEAEEAASRIRADLPAYHRALGAVLEGSAAALRQHAHSKRSPILRMFRGVHGQLTPDSANDVSQGRYSMRPLASWSMTFDRADSFASGRTRGAVIEALVPAGCLAIAPGGLEDEVMIFPIDITAERPSSSFHELEIVAVHPRSIA